MSRFDIRPLNLLGEAGDPRHLLQRAFEHFSRELARRMVGVQLLEVVRTMRAGGAMKPNTFVPYDPRLGAMTLVFPPTTGNDGAQIVPVNVTDSTNTVTFAAEVEGDTVSGTATSSTAFGPNWFVCDEAEHRWVRAS